MVDAIVNLGRVAPEEWTRSSVGSSGSSSPPWPRRTCSSAAPGIPARRDRRCRQGGMHLYRSHPFHVARALLMEEDGRIPPRATRLSIILVVLAATDHLDVVVDMGGAMERSRRRAPGGVRHPFTDVLLLYICPCRSCTWGYGVGDGAVGSGGVCVLGIESAAVVRDPPQRADQPSRHGRLLRELHGRGGANVAVVEGTRGEGAGRRR